MEMVAVHLHLCSGCSVFASPEVAESLQVKGVCEVNLIFNTVTPWHCTVGQTRFLFLKQVNLTFWESSNTRSSPQWTPDRGATKASVAALVGFQITSTPAQSAAPLLHSVSQATECLRNDTNFSQCRLPLSDFRLSCGSLFCSSLCRWKVNFHWCGCPRNEPGD